MPVDVLILNSGEWLLADELAAMPWHILIYKLRGGRQNELHLWLPRDGTRSGKYAFRRYWLDGPVRWCVEIPPDPDRLRPAATDTLRIRFSTPDGLVLWADCDCSTGLGDFTDSELVRLRQAAEIGPYTRI